LGAGDQADVLQTRVGGLVSWLRFGYGAGFSHSACLTRPAPLIEQDHRFMKKRIVASRWFRSVQGAVQVVLQPAYNFSWEMPPLPSVL
jgi:hypothetical protein